MAEYEYRMLSFSGDQTRADVRRALAEHAEYGHWDLLRVTLYVGGSRKIVLRRRVIRVQRTA